jgi:hypothetical protein
MRTVVQGPGLSLFLLWMCVPPAAADAQFRPAAPPAVGEDYHVEGAIAWWDPSPELIINSESIGIPGTDIDLIEDLGIEQKRHIEFRVVLRPARKHKFRFAYLPIKYEAETVIQREFVFNGQRYRVGLPVETAAEFITYRFGYEYDFFYRSRGYIGALVELKYNDVQVELNSPIGLEFTSQVAPIPTFGVAGRGYLSANVSVTGEWTFFKVPDDLSEDYDGQYFDLDIYGTVNFNNYVGAQLGWRTIDIFYEGDEDRGDLQFRGWYFGGVVRF